MPGVSQLLFGLFGRHENNNDGSTIYNVLLPKHGDSGAWQRYGLALRVYLLSKTRFKRKLPGTGSDFLTISSCPGPLFAILVRQLPKHRGGPVQLGRPTEQGRKPSLLR